MCLCFPSSYCAAQFSPSLVSGRERVGRIHRSINAAVQCVGCMETHYKNVYNMCTVYVRQYSAVHCSKEHRVQYTKYSVQNTESTAVQLSI